MNNNEKFIINILNMRADQVADLAQNLKNNLGITSEERERLSQNLKVLIQNI